MTLVVGPLAAGQAQFDLRLPVFEIQRQRDQRQASLGGRASEPVNLFAMHQQLTCTARLMVGPRAQRVLRNVDVVQPRFAVGDLGKPIDKGRAPGPQ